VSNEDLAGPKGFKAELQRRIQASPTREVAIFVHGFNTIYPEAVLFATQLVHDTKFKGVPVLFTWPSEGRVFGYMYDRDSVLTSRDHLDATIRMAAAAGAKRIMLLAHSMGSMLTMETLRQAGFRGDASYGGKLQQVMLASPDISIDVFISQRSRIGPLPRIVVVLSRDDRALSVSKWLSGEVERLGSFRDDALLAKMDVSVVDLTEVSVGNITRHSKFAHLPELLNGLARHAEQDGEPTGGPGVPFTVKKVVLGTMGTANIILSSPFRALEKVLGEGSNVR
jgi:esterase/lipase superfamily enzyme